MDCTNRDRHNDFITACCGDETIDLQELQLYDDVCGAWPVLYQLLNHGYRLNVVSE